MTPLERYYQMLEMRNTGKTYKVIAEHFGISRQRVQQRLAMGPPGTPYPGTDFPRTIKILFDGRPKILRTRY